MVKLYARLTGVIMLIVGIFGFLTDNLFGLIQFDSVHNMIHLLIAAFALYVGFAADNTSLPDLFAEVMGIVYVLLGVAGFMNPILFGLLGPLHLEPLENLLHLMLGLWGIGITMGIGKTRMAHS